MNKVVSALAAGVLMTAGCAAPTVAPSGATQRVELHYAGGAADGGVQQVDVPLGSSVTLVATSDVDDDLHLHGYDRLVGMPAGGTATLTFTADLPGVFEVEAERTGTQLARLEIR